MKRTLITTAVILMTVFASSEAKAELTLVTSNNGSFNFDGSATGADNDFNVGLPGSSDDGLNDLAFFVGYRPSFGGGPDQIVRLTGPDTAGTNTSLNEGTFDFDAVSFAGSDGSTITVNADAFFRLTDTTSSTNPLDTGANLLYELNLDADGFNDANQGNLLSFVGFDFNAGAATAASPGSTIPGFGTSNLELSNASGDRFVSLDGSFDAGTGNSDAATGVDTDNANFDAFTGLIGADLAARFDAVDDLTTATGNLGFGAFSNFGVASNDVNESTAGVFQFRSLSDGVTATIPEPSTLLMASMGLGMVAFRRRRKQQA